jgi:hypothetical protein
VRKLSGEAQVVHKLDRRLGRRDATHNEENEEEQEEEEVNIVVKPTSEKNHLNFEELQNEANPLY